MKSLDCQICKEKYTAPMTLDCLHSFCSLCIRTCLRNRLVCPLCQVQVDGYHSLKKNTHLEEIVQEYKTLARVLGKAVKEGSLDTNTVDPKNKSAREELQPLESMPKDSLKAPAEGSEKSFTGPCPICANLINYSKVNAHIDSNCTKFIETLVDLEPKVEHRKTQKPQYKAHLPYSLYKTQKLKELIQKDGLQVTGSRAQIIKFHQSFIDLYNSNQDSPNPKSQRQLLQEYHQLINDTGNTSVTPTISNEEYLKENKNEFDDMIAKMKERAAQKKRKISHSTTEVNDASTTVDSANAISNPTVSKPSIQLPLVEGKPESVCLDVNVSKDESVKVSDVESNDLMVVEELKSLPKSTDTNLPNANVLKESVLNLPKEEPPKLINPLLPNLDFDNFPFDPVEFDD